MDKQEIRKRISAARKGISREDAMEKSRQIIEKLRSLKEYNDAGIVMSYISLDDEVDTREFIKEELGAKEIIVPFVAGDIIKAVKLKRFDLVEGDFGVLEPKEKIEHKEGIDLVLVPGIAFDEKGGRIGFGRGYYDKFLKDFDNSLKIGLAFEEQMVDLVPMEEHDKHVDIIVTEKRIIRCNNG